MLSSEFPKSAISIHHSALRDHFPRRRDRLFEIGDVSVHLLFIDGLQDFTNTRAGFQTEFEDVASEQQRRGRAMLHAEAAGAVQEPVHRFASEGAWLPAEAVGFCDSSQQLEVDLLREPAEGPV